LAQLHLGEIAMLGLRKQPKGIESHPSYIRVLGIPRLLLQPKL
jgi:hypothetical protein